jgi:hypothetical protein
MMDHNKEWKLDKEESYSLYNENVVSFLLDKCGLDGQYTKEEIFHALGKVIDTKYYKQKLYDLAPELNFLCSCAIQSTSLTFLNYAQMHLCPK